MKKSDVNNSLHENTNEELMNVLNSVPEIRFVYRLDDALRKRGISQAKLATLCGIRPATVSEIVKGTRSAITKSHIATIMIALRITDIREIIDIEFGPETKEQFDAEAEAWVEKGAIPTEIESLYAQNSRNLANHSLRD